MILKTLQLFVIAFLVSSCTFIVFDQPMPPGEGNLTEIPEILRGQYTYEVQRQVTKVEIGENYFITDSLPEYLSDSLVLKPFGKRYVLNKKVNDPNMAADGKWLCYILSPCRKGRIDVDVLCIADTTYEEKLMRRYGGQRMKAPHKFGDSFLYLDADLKQFKKLRRDKKAHIPLVLRPVK